MVRHWPLLLALTALWLTLAILLILSRGQTEGHLIYTLDDPYIHMAMAKNLAQHGVWGVTRYEFSSSSSSLLWTLLIAFIYLFTGPVESVPFLLNVGLATLVVIAGYLWLARAGLRPLYICFLLLGLFFLTPLPALVFTGQEHLLHLLLSLLFLHQAVRLLSGEEINRRRLLLLAVLLPLARYEGLFLLFPVFLLLLARRGWRYGLALLLAALLPIALYGAVSVAHGAFWLPNSVLLKGQTPDPTTLEGIIRLVGYNAYTQLLAYPHMLALALVVLALLEWRRWRGAAWWGYETLWLGIFLLTLLLHMQFALVGWFYRYEAYLVGMGWLAIGALGGRKVPLLPLTLLLALLPRGVSALREIPAASANIYGQQYQTGLFLQRYYQGATVALHDIGAPTFLADIRLLDLWGLGSAEVAAARRAGTFDRPMIEQMVRARGARVAIFYETWLTAGEWGVIPAGNEGGIPTNWIKAGQWQIANPVILSSDRLAFYAVGAEEEARLVRHLSDFAPRLPATVREQGSASATREAARTFDNLLQRFRQGQLLVPAEAGAAMVHAASFTMPDGEWGNVLFLHPPTSVAYRVTLPKQPVELRFRAAMAPASWGWGGDGSTFVVTIETESGARAELHRQHIGNAPEEQRWHEVVVPLDAYAGQAVTLTLSTEFGPLGDSVGDWAGWEEPRLLWREFRP